MKNKIEEQSIVATHNDTEGYAIAEALPMCNCKGAREIKSVGPKFICRTCNRPVLYNNSTVDLELEVSLPKEFSDEINIYSNR